MWLKLSFAEMKQKRQLYKSGGEITTVKLSLFVSVKLIMIPLCLKLKSDEKTI